MATWYVDPEGGNDSNGGTSFANRVKSFNAFTPAAGDSVRIIASPSPWSIGSATWTDNSGNITLAAAVNLTLDNMQATTGWVAGTNVTIAASASNRRYGSNQLLFTLSSSFVAGALIAYKAVSALDLSSFSCLSALFGWNTTPQSTTNISIALCSDSAGATPLVTLSGDQFIASAGVNNTSNQFENGGSALPSGINSIAIYASGSTKPFSSSGSFFMSNLIACKAMNAANHLSHISVIGKKTTGEPEWYPIQYIDGTTVNLGWTGDVNRSGGSKAYRGTTETVTTYAQVGLRTRMNSTTKAVKTSGTATSPITWTGGWDRTAMSSQTGQSWLNGQRMQADMWTSNVAWHIMPDSTIGMMYANSGSAILLTNVVGRIFHLAGIVDCTYLYSNNSTVSGTYGVTDIAADSVVFCDNGLYLRYDNNAQMKVRIRRITGCNTAGVSCLQNMDDRSTDIVVSQVDNCTLGVALTNSLSFGAWFRMRGTTFKNNTADVALNTYCGLDLDRPSFPSAPVITGAGSTSGNPYVRMTAVGGARWDNRMYRTDVTQVADQSTVHGAAAQSVKVTVVTNTMMTSVPYRTRLMRVAALSGKTITATAWVQRSDSTNLGAGLTTAQGAVAGVADASVAAAAASSTWEQLTITFTPTEDGVVDVYGYVTNPTNSSSANGQSVWFGDMGVSST